MLVFPVTTLPDGTRSGFLDTVVRYLLVIRSSPCIILPSSQSASIQYDGLCPRSSSAVPNVTNSRSRWGASWRSTKFSAYVGKRNLGWSGCHFELGLVRMQFSLHCVCYRVEGDCSEWTAALTKSCPISDDRIKSRPSRGNSSSECGCGSTSDKNFRYICRQFILLADANAGHNCSSACHATSYACSWRWVALYQDRTADVVSCEIHAVADATLHCLQRDFQRMRANADEAGFIHCCSDLLNLRGSFGVAGILFASPHAHT
jgi:hypothetical protein